MICFGSILEKIAVPLPFRLEDGSLSLYDLTPHVWPAALFMGHPDDALWRRFIANTLQVPFEDTPAGDALQLYLVQAGLIRDITKPRMYEGQSGLSQVIDAGARTGVLPAVVPKFMSITKQAGGAGPMRLGSKPSMTPGEAIVKETGISTLPAGTAAGMLSRKKELNAEVMRLQQDFATATKVGDLQAKDTILARLHVLMKQLQEMNVLETARPKQ